MDIVHAVEKIGPLVGIIVFFVWRDYVRERKHVSRIEALERYQKRVLQKMVERTHVVLWQVVEALKK